MTYKAKNEWYFDCQTDEDKKKRDEFLGNNTLFIRLLEQVLSRKIEMLDRKQLKEEFYESPELLSRLCFANGALKALEDVYNLLQPLTPRGETK